MKIKTEDIHRYINELQDDNIIDIYILNDIKELIYSKYGKDSSYINNTVIGHIDRQSSYIKKTDFKGNLDKISLENFTEYIDYLLGDETNYFHNYMKEAIENTFVTSGWGEDVKNILSFTGILQQIRRHLKILDLIKQDEENKITKKSDTKKKNLNDAIKLLSEYTSNPHLLYHLKELDIEEKTISQTIALSSFFYQYTDIIHNRFDATKSEAISLARDIMSYVFNDDSDYRIYKHTRSIQYRGLTLTSYSKK